MSQNASLSLFGSLVTTSDRQLYLERINQLKLAAFTVKQLQEDVALDDIDREIRAYLRACVVNANSSTLEKALDLLKDQLIQAEEVGVQVAFAPTRKELMKIANSLMRTFGKKVVLRVKIAPEIWGGAIVEFGGVITDKSLRSQVLKSIHGSV